MKRYAQATLFALVSTGAIVASHAADTRSLSLDEVLGKPQLIGHQVDVTACSGVPISDAPTAEEYVLLFHCDQSDLEEANNTNAAFGHFTKSTTVKAAPDAGQPIDDSPLFKGRFRGTLRKGTSAEDMQGMLVIELSDLQLLKWIPMPELPQSHRPKVKFYTPPEAAQDPY